MNFCRYLITGFGSSLKTNLRSSTNASKRGGTKANSSGMCTNSNISHGADCCSGSRTNLCITEKMNPYSRLEISLFTCQRINFLSGSKTNFLSSTSTIIGGGIDENTSGINKISTDIDTNNNGHQTANLSSNPRKKFSSGTIIDFCSSFRKHFRSSPREKSLSGTRKNFSASPSANVSSSPSTTNSSNTSINNSCSTSASNNSNKNPNSNRNCTERE